MYVARVCLYLKDRRDYHNYVTHHVIYITGHQNSIRNILGLNSSITIHALLIIILHESLLKTVF